MHPLIPILMLADGDPHGDRAAPMRAALLLHIAASA